jgi:hypothetical protein
MNDDITTSFTKLCPKCGKEQIYKKVSNYNKAVKLNRQCRKCMFGSDEYKSKHRTNTSKMWMDLEKKEYILERRNSPESKEKWCKSAASTFSDPAYTEKQKKIQVSFLMNHPEKVEAHRQYMSNAWRNKQSSFNSDVFREKLRNHRIEQIKRLGVITSNYNPIACNYFNMLNTEKKWELQHALNGGEVRCAGYFLDAYDRKRNIVVEYDEPSHYTFGGKLKIKDTLRQERIIRRLKPFLFLRFNERKNELYEVTVRKEG